ncbi:FxSxx-COOH cyclophane-containing RiPP peptide [Actinocrispum wychmicini]|uniref:FXSXX-COOH protein n=1 Tax=Actinocrispum wychmicini TaxID=1213861 RepID=A0A4R2J4A4_9PSEU|nr:FxSxx-COOH cyclophane-containing RiPP peptide [Actinocrispum wychmicini]TCO53511.1 FXSXX-COOH protein [Actinocrispum wychmicini]
MRDKEIRTCADSVEGLSGMPEDVVIESVLLDVTDLDPDELAELPESVLGAALRRILAANAELPDQYAAFQSAL